MKKENGVLIDVTEEDFELLKYNPEKFWKGVTEIGDNAFTQYTSLKSIVIPEGVTKIGANAFAGCANLKNIELPDSIDSIGRYAFANSGIVSIRMPRYISKLNDGLFSGCWSLKNITIPQTISHIGSNVFSGCEQLEFFEISDNLKFMGNGLFIGCKKLSLKYRDAILDNLLDKSEQIYQLFGMEDEKKFDELVNLYNHNIDVKLFGFYQLDKINISYWNNLMKKVVPTIDKENFEDYEELVSHMQEHGNEGLITQIYEWFIERSKLALNENEDDTNVSTLPKGEKNRYRVRTSEPGETGIEKQGGNPLLLNCLSKNFQ